MRILRLSVCWAALFASASGAATADWSFEERSGPKGRIHSARNGIYMGVECSRNGASLWVRVPLANWERKSSPQASILFEMRRKRLLGLLPHTERDILFGRLYPPVPSTFAGGGVRAEGRRTIEVAKKLAGAHEVTVTVDTTTPGLLPPTGNKFTISLAGAEGAIGEVIKRCDFAR